MLTLTGLGQDSHRIETIKTKPLILGGIEIESDFSLQGNSDADPVLHALTNAISSITGVNIIGEYSDRLCSIEGITDSAIYLEHSLQYLTGYRLAHIAISIECLVPKISPNLDRMKKRIEMLTNVSSDHIGITATSGEGLTSFGKGEGIQAFVIITVVENNGK
jgi:2-C-methyl-D-erythritol 2,4-cyclodiphosphate synthase